MTTQSNTSMGWDALFIEPPYYFRSSRREAMVILRIPPQRCSNNKSADTETKIVVVTFFCEFICNVISVFGLLDNRACNVESRTAHGIIQITRAKSTIPSAKFKRVEVFLFGSLVLACSAKGKCRVIAKPVCFVSCHRQLL